MRHKSFHRIINPALCFKLTRYSVSGMTDLSRSTSTVNNESGIHTLSRNSVILTQELKTARPPRPNSMRNSHMHNSRYVISKLNVEVKFNKTYFFIQNQLIHPYARAHFYLCRFQHVI